MKTSATKAKRDTSSGGRGRKILVIDDSLMLLSFVNEILTEAELSRSQLRRRRRKVWTRPQPKSPT